MLPYWLRQAQPDQEATILWWLYQGCSPLPIPNREVKPLMADGTWTQSWESR